MPPQTHIFKHEVGTCSEQRGTKTLSKDVCKPLSERHKLYPKLLLCNPFFDKVYNHVNVLSSGAEQG